jgi:hypothetical protein
MSATSKPRNRGAAARGTKRKFATTKRSIKSVSTKSLHKPASGKNRNIKRSGGPAAGSKNKGPYGVREASKLGIMIAMLHRREGATVEALSEATGWQAHSVRGAIAGALKKKLGLTVASVKTDGVRIYRITDEAAR